MSSVRESRSDAAVDSVLRPDSVVVIGASARPTGFASAPLKNLNRHAYQGTIYAVNPNYQEIDGVRCYPALSDLPDTPDTAVVVVGAQQVPEVLADCADRGIKSATVVAGGFAELGELGDQLESEVRALCASTGLRIVGPNTAGLLNVADSYIPRAAVNHPDQLTPGGLAILTQSGALCNTLLNRVLARGLGLSYAVATGSQWDLDLWDFVEYCIADTRTSAVLMIVEGLKDPERCLQAVAKSVEARKPIVMLKLGKSDEARLAVETHSGALAGTAEVQLSILEQSGVIVVDELDELWEVGQLFDRWGGRHPVEPPRRLVVGAYSGGDGAIAVDAAVEAGLECPALSPDTVAELSSTFTLATPANPFDYTGEVIGRPELIGPATAALLNDPACEVFLLAGPVWSSSFADWVLRPALEEVQRHPHRSSAVSLWSAGRFTDAAEEVVREFGMLSAYQTL